MHIRLLQDTKTGKGLCLWPDVFSLQHTADFHFALNPAICFWWAGLTEHRLLVCGGVCDGLLRLRAAAAVQNISRELNKERQVWDDRVVLGWICQNGPECADTTRQTTYQWVSNLYYSHRMNYNHFEEIKILAFFVIWFYDIYYMSIFMCVCVCVLHYYYTTIFTLYTVYFIFWDVL